MKTMKVITKITVFSLFVILMSITGKSEDYNAPDPYSDTHDAPTQSDTLAVEPDQDPNQNPAQQTQNPDDEAVADAGDPQQTQEVRDSLDQEVAPTPEPEPRYHEDTYQN